MLSPGLFLCKGKYKMPRREETCFDFSSENVTKVHMFVSFNSGEKKCLFRIFLPLICSFFETDWLQGIIHLLVNYSY